MEKGRENDEMIIEKENWYRERISRQVKELKKKRESRNEGVSLEWL